MSDVTYAQSLLVEAFPIGKYGSVKAIINAAHRVISRQVKKDFTYRRARSIWEGTARRIDAEEIDALRLAAIEESKREQTELRARLAALDAKLARIDAASAGAQMATDRRPEARLG